MRAKDKEMSYRHAEDMNREFGRMNAAQERQAKAIEELVKLMERKNPWKEPTWRQ